MENIRTNVLERFIRYTAIDTQSDPHSSTYPSTEKQKDLGRLLVEELKAMQLEAELDEFGYVYATIPANTDKNVPVLCFCSHMDTSPDCSGTGVKAIVHTAYTGTDIVFPDDGTQIIRLKDHPDLEHQLGNDIVTASGTTLLGADNKAGVAEIMELARYLTSNPSHRHGTIKILFTPDEEIGRGVDKVDLEKLGADVAYTVDGETAGSIEDETFSADGAELVIYGVSTHPGFAYKKMESAIKIVAEVISRLPQDHLSPESTVDKEGFIHPVGISGGVEEARVEFIIRDFSTELLKQHERTLERIVKEVMADFPNSTYSLTFGEQYRNMKEIIDQNPKIVELGIKAIELAGMKPKLRSIRGGTDGSRLSFMGLPCPNLFAGEHAFHSKQEWVSVQDMEKAVHMLINLSALWEAEGKN